MHCIQDSKLTGTRNLGREKRVSLKIVTKIVTNIVITNISCTGFKAGESLKTSEGISAVLRKSSRISS